MKKHNRIVVLLLGLLFLSACKSANMQDALKVTPNYTISPENTFTVAPAISSSPRGLVGTAAPPTGAAISTAIVTGVGTIAVTPTTTSVRTMSPVTTPR